MADMPAASLVAQYWSFVVVAVFVYLLGESGKRLAFWMKLRTPTGVPTPDTFLAHVYDVSLPVQPLIAGALFGFVPLPVPAWVGEDLVAHCGWFLLAGALCGQVYEAIKRTIWKTAEIKSQRATTTPPPPGAPRPPPLPAADDEDDDGGSPAR